MARCQMFCMFVDIVAVGVYVSFYKHFFIVQDVTYKNVICQQPIFTASMEVPSEVLQKLVCENCDDYLARGPVHLMDNVRYRCGRCLPSEDVPGTRIEAYEELAKLMTFPCRYRRKGCKSKVRFVENEAHEEACPYREFICPIAESGQCEWTGIQTGLLEHCRQDHPNNIVENPCKFTHNITQSSLHNYLLCTLGVLFLIQTKVCTVTRTIYHSVRLIGDPASASNYKYTLSIQNKDSNFSKQRVVAPRGCLAVQHDNSIETFIDLLLLKLKDFTGTTFTVTVESAGNVTTIEARVECSQCRKRTEPVYRGGWLCLCDAPERYPCWNKAKGCSYTDFTGKCDKHRLFHCQYITRCDICSANISRTSLEAHYTQAHRNITIKVGSGCIIRPVCDYFQYFIMDCDFGKTVCTFRMDGSGRSEFILNVMTPLPSDQLYKYRCTVEISHPNMGQSVTRTPSVWYNSVSDWHVRLTPSHGLLHHGMENFNLIVKINITKLQDPTELIF